MALKADGLLSRYNELKAAATGRNAAWDELWRRYTGEYYAKGATEGMGGIRVSAPLISARVQKHTELFAFPVAIEVPPQDESAKGKRRADTVEKALYAVWEANRMDQQLLVIGCYLSLFGVFFMRAFPDPTWEGKVRLYAPDPRECYPELSARGWQSIRRIFWEHWLIGEEVKELYPKAKGTYEDLTTYLVVECWDARDYWLISGESGEVLWHAAHSLGRVPFAFAQNRPLPKKEYGLSDVEHSVGMEDVFNELLSAQVDITEYYADPTLVIRGQKYGTELRPGPGGAIHVDQGGDAKFLQHEGTPPSTEAVLNRVLALHADLCGTTEPLMGRVGTGGARTGAGVTQLLVSGQTPRLTLKETQAGGALSDMNEVVLRLLEGLWGERGVKLRGQRKRQPFEIELKASDIGGRYKNYINWGPGIFDYAQRLASALQMVGAGLKSRYTAMEELGIRSPADEKKRILEEQKQDLAAQQALAKLAAARMPGEVAKEGRTLEKGGLPKRMQKLGKMAEIAGGAGGEEGSEGEEEESEEESEPRGGERSEKAGRLHFHEIIPQLVKIHNLAGKAYIIGGIVTEGYTDRDVDVLLEKRSDAPKILRVVRSVLGEAGAKRIHFSPTKTAPTSPHVTIGEVVAGGGLKAAAIKVFRLVPVAKPEKKALTTNEAFSLKGLRAKLPQGHTWDVSAKMDGIRCQLHRVGNQVRLFSDEAHEIPEAKIAAVAAEARKTLPERCILDGELMLYLGGANQHHEGVVRYLHTKATDAREAAGVRYACWDILWNGTDLTGRPFAERSRILGEDQKGRIHRAPHTRASLEGLPAAIRKVGAPEGAMIRAEEAAYWATHLMFKFKKMYDVDVTVVQVRPTKGGAETYVCADRQGNIVGVTYAASHLKGTVKKGDVITVSVQKVARYVKDSKESFHWFSPIPSRTTAIRRKGADPSSVFAEIWKETRGKYLRGGLKAQEVARGG